MQDNNFNYVDLYMNKKEVITVYSLHIKSTSWFRLNQEIMDFFKWGKKWWYHNLTFHYYQESIQNIEQFTR